MSDAPVLHITDRLRGKYTLAVNDGAGLLNGSDTFTRQFETPPIQHEAAAIIDDLLEALMALTEDVDEIVFGTVAHTPIRVIFPHIGEDLDDARAAIAKATGAA